MHILSTTHDIGITDTPLKDEDWLSLLCDPNCQKAFPNLMPLGLPMGSYLKMFQKIERRLELAGVMAILHDPTQGNRVQLHLLVFSYSSHKYIRHFCELCTLYCQLNQLEPHTIVRDIPELQYMVNFLHRAGAPSITKDGFHIFYLPRNWRPRYTKEVKIGWHEIS